ncbi:hypothetical protein [Streptomyces longispororuber]|uniref:hypothetical protein n=1 Tax=Streptomyces longispororuber TaxID=68230 RepID=UPI00167CECEC|nr:hypothetical protein [Streptomyces longispororuber]
MTPRSAHVSPHVSSHVSRRVAPVRLLRSVPVVGAEARRGRRAADEDGAEALTG